MKFIICRYAKICALFAGFARHRVNIFFVEITHYRVRERRRTTGARAASRPTGAATLHSRSSLLLDGQLRVLPYGRQCPPLSLSARCPFAVKV